MNSNTNRKREKVRMKGMSSMSETRKQESDAEEVGPESDYVA